MNITSSHNTAILVFAHSSEEELRHKKINKGIILFDALTKHTLKTVKETGIPFFHFHEELQHGVSFGERFSNAIQSVFDLGYENIITVGNDSPHLTKTHIITALSALDNQKLVIGPSCDGGFYLMGLCQKDFEKSAFEELSWQTSKIREEVLELFSPIDSGYFILPQLFDIDSVWDIRAMATSTSRLSKRILSAITAIISVKGVIKIPLFISATGFYFRIPSNKGSPVPFIS